MARVLWKSTFKYYLNCLLQSQYQYQSFSKVKIIIMVLKGEDNQQFLSTLSHLLDIGQKSVRNEWENDKQTPRYIQIFLAIYPFLPLLLSHQKIIQLIELILKYAKQIYISQQIILIYIMSQNPAQNQAQNIKFKVKEFEWFQMETKVRQIIQEVLGALQKRILESSSIINKLKFNQGECEKKIEEITLMIENDPKVFETGIFASVDRRFEQQEKKIQELSRQIMEENKYVDQKFKILDIRMQQSSEVLQNVASLRERVSREIEIQNQNINTVRLNIEQMISDLNSDIRQTRKQQQDNFQTCQKADYNLGQKIEKNTQDIKKMKDLLEIHKEMHRDQGVKLQYTFQNLKKHSQSIQGLQQSKVLTKKLEYYVKDLENQLRKVDFKLEAVSPLITQAQISECLYNVLPPKMRKRIAIHQHKKYFKLNRQVLEKQYKQVEIKFKGLDLLEEMQKKNTKQIVQMKRKKLQAMGIDVDNLTYEQREKYYNEMVLDEVVNDEDQQVKVTAKADQKQILAIVNKHFTDFIGTIKQKVAIQLEDSKKYLYGLEQEIRYEISTYENKIKQVKDSITIIQSDQLLENKAFSESFKQIHKLFEQNDYDHARMNQTQKAFYNFCSLVNHLQIQDQIDKQNISLMGVSENNSEDVPNIKSKNSIVELDKKCFSCCGFPASTLSAFKMACLAYNPSSIIIDSREYRREELLGITTNLLQKIKKGFISTNKTLTPNMNQSQIEGGVEVFQQDDRIQFTNQQVKNKVNDPQNDFLTKKKDSGVKFRKTKKFVGNSATKYYNKSIGSKQSTALKEDLMTATQMFTELKKRNLTFLQ